MVIHIVNGFEREKPSFLQFIHKTEQFCGPILVGKNQKRWSLPGRPIKDPTDRVVRNRRANQTARILDNPFLVVG